MGLSKNPAPNVSYPGVGDYIAMRVLLMDVSLSSRLCGIYKGMMKNSRVTSRRLNTYAYIRSCRNIRDYRTCRRTCRARASTGLDNFQFANG
jgi:hypothetical protein